MILAESLQAFKLHVAALQLPLVVLFEQQRADESGDGRFVREDAHDVGAPLDLGVQSFQWIGAVDLCAMRFGEAVSIRPTSCSVHGAVKFRCP